MGKFSEMDILINEAYENGFKAGWKDAATEAQKIVVDYLNPVKKAKTILAKYGEAIFILAGLTATILLLGSI